MILFFLKIYSKKDQESKHYNYQIIFKFHDEKILKNNLNLYLYSIHIYILVKMLHIEDLFFFIFLAMKFNFIYLFKHFKFYHWNKSGRRDASD